jgi:drug/metabolite transporter (DMT)-like permease
MAALQKLELSKVAIISQTQPIYVVIISALILLQMPSFREIIGGLFLTAGCLIMILGRSRKRKPGAFLTK